MGIFFCHHVTSGSLSCGAAQSADEVLGASPINWSKLKPFRERPVSLTDVQISLAVPPSEVANRMDDVLRPLMSLRIFGRKKSRSAAAIHSSAVSVVQFL